MPADSGGGKGIGVSDCFTAGAFARCGAIGTLSGVNPDYIDDNGDRHPLLVKAKNRLDRNKEMIQHSIRAIVSQAKRAADISGKRGRIHMNVLWEMGGTEQILNESLEKAKGMIHGIVCGAGLPFKLSEICAKYKTYYYPIVSSMRAFKILWKRSYERTKEWLGGVIYECPWRAGGHNGLSNAEDPYKFGDSYSRVVELRAYMNEQGLHDTPIIVAGGIWNIKEFEAWLTDPKIGKVCFQFGTRPMLTQESPISAYWKEALLNIKEEDVKTNRFSPTGFYSSAINTDLLKGLFERLKREIKYSVIASDEFDTEIVCGKTKKQYFIRAADKESVQAWLKNGFTEGLRTPDETLVFVSEGTIDEMRQDFKDCIGCLSCCKYSTWSQYFPEQNYTCGTISDPRSFCIQKALQNAHQDKDRAKQLFFAGSNAYRFASDPMYAEGHVPTIKELVGALVEGR